jgi:hypothetical protein
LSSFGHWHRAATGKAEREMQFAFEFARLL